MNQTVVEAVTPHQNQRGKFVLPGDFRCSCVGCFMLHVELNRTSKAASQFTANISALISISFLVIRTVDLIRAPAQVNRMETKQSNQPTTHQRHRSPNTMRPRAITRRRSEAMRRRALALSRATITVPVSITMTSGRRKVIPRIPMR
jgi:hypothetical protein